MIIAFSEQTSSNRQVGSAVFARDVLGCGFVELVDFAAKPSAQMHIESCLKEAPNLHFYAAFIEAQPQWAPDYLPDAALRHVLWTRCSGSEQALKAADVLVRDENFQLVIVDLRQLSHRALQKIPQTDWYRLQRISQSQSSTLVIATPYPVIAAAQMRIEVQSAFSIESFHEQRSQLWPQIKAEVTRKRSQSTDNRGWIPIGTESSKRIQAS